MKTLKSQSTFERYALECELRERPGCETLQRALTDFLMEMGYTYLGARREVLATVRAGVQMRECDRMERIWEDTIVAREHVRARIAQAMRLDQWQVKEVEFTLGMVPPSMTPGVRWWTTREGRVVLNLHDCNPDEDLIEHCTDRRIVVGAGWVLARLRSVFDFLEV